MYYVGSLLRVILLQHVLTVCNQSIIQHLLVQAVADQPLRNIDRQYQLCRGPGVQRLLLLCLTAWNFLLFSCCSGLSLPDCILNNSCEPVQQEILIVHFPVLHGVLGIPRLL